MARFVHTPELIAQVIALYEAGGTIQGVADAVGLKSWVTRQILKTARVQLRNTRPSAPPPPRPTTDAAKTFSAKLTTRERALAQHATRKQVR